MVSLNCLWWHRHADTGESQSAERLSYVGDVAPPTRIPVNELAKQRPLAYGNTSATRFLLVCFVLLVDCQFLMNRVSNYFALQE